MMKKFLLMAACVLALFACKKEGGEVPTPAGGSIVGVWELTSVATKATVGDVEVSVFVQFDEGDHFVLYQKIGAGRYRVLEGNYALAADGKLSGAYMDGGNWGPYDVVVSDETLALTSPNGKEVDTYRKISAVPEYAITNIY